MLVSNILYPHSPPHTCSSLEIHHKHRLRYLRTVDYVWYLRDRNVSFIHQGIVIPLHFLSSFTWSSFLSEKKDVTWSLIPLSTSGIGEQCGVNERSFDLWQYCGIFDANIGVNNNNVCNFRRTFRLLFFPCLFSIGGLILCSFHCFL